jgi:hypothetical protein
MISFHLMKDVSCESGRLVIDHLMVSPAEKYHVIIGIEFIRRIRWIMPCSLRS